MNDIRFTPFEPFSSDTPEDDSTMFDRLTPTFVPFSAFDFDNPESEEGPTIFNSYYGRDVPIYGYRNCGDDRKSIQQYPLIVQRYLSHICDTLPLENVKYILGPLTYAEYESNGVTVSIFGEDHRIGTLSHCIEDDPKATITAYDFLDAVLKQHPDNFYDVYLEIKENKYKNQYTINDTYINAFKMMNGAFARCALLHENCPYQNARIHYTDMRGTLDIKALADGAPRDSIALFIRYVYENNPIIIKEIKRSYMGEQILKYIETIIEIYQNNPKSSQVDIAYAVSAVLMDMYLLARVFKVFKPSERQPSNVQHAIIYVGELHAKHYRDFFEVLLGIKPKILTINTSGESTDFNSCLNIEHFKHTSKLF
jgi:hypothetical protein